MTDGCVGTTRIPQGVARGSLLFHKRQTRELSRTKNAWWFHAVAPQLHTIKCITAV